MSLLPVKLLTALTTNLADEPGRAAKLLTKDEARLIAAKQREATGAIA